MQCRVLFTSCIRVTAKYSHTHSEEAAACNLYMFCGSGERQFPIKDLESKSEWCKCWKGHTVGIVVVASGNVEAVRLSTLLHNFTGDLSEHKHWWIQHWNGCSEKHTVILKSCIFVCCYYWHHWSCPNRLAQKSVTLTVMHSSGILNKVQVFWDMTSYH